MTDTKGSEPERAQADIVEGGPTILVDNHPSFSKWKEAVQEVLAAKGRLLVAENPVERRLCESEYRQALYAYDRLRDELTSAVSSKTFDECLKIASELKKTDICTVPVTFLRYDRFSADDGLDDMDAYWDLLSGLLKVLLRQLENFAEDCTISNPRLVQRAAEMTLALLNHDLPEGQLRDELLSKCQDVIELMEFDDAPECATKAIESIRQYRVHLIDRALNPD